LSGAARERTPDPIITNLTVLDFSGFPGSLPSPRLKVKTANYDFP
jgi:hypothetical protein